MSTNKQIQQQSTAAAKNVARSSLALILNPRSEYSPEEKSARADDVIAYFLRRIGHGDIADQFMEAKRK